MMENELLEIYKGIRCEVCYKNMISYECQRCGKQLCFNCVREGSFCPDCYRLMKKD